MAKLAKRKGLKIPHIRNAAGSNPAFGTQFMIKIIKQLVDKDCPYLFSLSMGVDSVAAFLWMKSKGYNVIPIHFNHGLREQNELMEEKFYLLCSDLKLTNCRAPKSSNYFFPRSVRGFYAEKNTTKVKTESEFRNIRLNFYQRACNWIKTHYDFSETPIIVTAHHLNDYVENYLLNCFRGHPTHTPIEFVSKFDPPEDDNPDLFNTSYKIIHPFLLTKKEYFKQFLERNNYMKYVVEDETNKVTKGSRRNWIRNTIVPEMVNNKLSLEKFAKRKIESRLKLESFVLN